MRKWLRPDWRARLLDLFACFLIPLYTLLFTHDTRWFTTNFSVIAAARDQRHGFFLWGMLVGVYLLCVLLPVMAALPRPLWPQLCLLGGFLLLLSAVVLPYTPDELPKIADLHVICAFTASCLLVLSLFLLLLQKARQDRQRYWDCMKWLGVTVLLSLVLFAMVGIISSALEIFFVLSTTLLARRLWYLERGGGKN